MDHSRLDRLSQALANTGRHSRRVVLTALGVALLGTLAGVDPDAAGAKGKARKHSTGKRRHHATSRQHGTRGRLYAATSNRCPADSNCPDHLVCRKGKCLTSCTSDLDCTDGYTCDWARGTCQSPFICDCTNLNDCSGHGVCTETCNCLCDEGWSGAACTDQPAMECGDYTTCDMCQDALTKGCTWCLATVDGAVGVCTRGDTCIEPQEVCPSGR